MPQLSEHPKLAHPVNDFIVEILPDWLKSAGAVPIKALRAAVANHLASRTTLTALLKHLQPLDRFAKARLGPAIEAKLQMPLDLDTVVWREERLRLNPRPFDPGLGVLPPDYEQVLVYQPLLQTLLQNFTDGESFFEGTAVIKQQPAEGSSAQVLSSQIDDLVSLSRETDVGGAYLQHLDKVLTAELSTALANDLRTRLALVVEVAALRKQLHSSDLNMLRLLIQGKSARHAQGWVGAARALRVLDCQVDGAMAFELIEPPRRQGDFPVGPLRRVKGVIIYLPDDHERPLRRFADWDALNSALVRNMRGQVFKSAFTQRIALHERAGFLALLGKRMGDDEPDLQPSWLAEKDDVFTAMARRHTRRIREDARFLAVPTADVDRRASAERLAALEGVGLSLLDLAGLFVPAINAVLLGDLARQLLSQVYDGAEHWAHGHQHEALEHLVGLAESAVLLGTATFGVHALRSAFVDTLEPVTTESGLQRLWLNDLTPYRTAASDISLTERHDGLFSGDDQLWWHNQGVFYAVRQDSDGTWRLLHQGGVERFGPRLRGNGERGWWLRYDRPLEWQGSSRLLTSLWPAARSLTAEQVEQILLVAGVDEAQLRQLLVESRRLPVGLRDTLRRFEVQAENEAFFQPSGAGQKYAERLTWCLDRLWLHEQAPDAQLAAISDAAQRLRQPMLDHFADAGLPDDPALAVIRRDFPGLPKAYALDLLKAASPQMRQRMVEDIRLPLALAQQARVLLLEARQVRMREALYLRGSYGPDMVRLVFALLRRQGLSAGQINLVLRERSASGAVQARLLPAFGDAPQTLDLVWKDGSFQLYDERGLASDLEVAEPQGLFEVLAATLSNTVLARLGGSGENLAGHIRTRMQALLPQDREGLLALLGWREARPLGASIQRLDDGRVGYPLGPVLSCLDSPGTILRRRVRSLYPGFSEAQVERFIHFLLLRRSSPFTTLLRQEMEYDALDRSLRAWARQGSAEQWRLRTLASDEIRRAWRLEGPRIVEDVEGAHGETEARWSTRLTLAASPLGDLPDIPAGTDFSHVTRLTLVNLRLTVVPSGFLENFASLRSLDLRFNELHALPQGLERLTDLRELNLAGNRLRLTQAQADVLAGLTELRHLNLSDNPIGAVTLRVGQLADLHALVVRSAGLQAMPEGLERCQQLTLVDLRNNQIEAFPPILLNSPVQRRQVMVLSGNPVAATLSAQLSRHRLTPIEDAEPALSGSRWLATLDATEYAARSAQWDTLRATPGSDAFFGLLDELVESADFRAAAQATAERVWQVVGAAAGDERIRQDLFDIAADPRTCADSVAHCFSNLEVQMHVSQFTHNGAPAATSSERLQLAQRLFRLEKVNALARAVMDERYGNGQWRGTRDEEEVEVSLAYRTGLAERLNLLGQPRHMLFGTLAGVTQADLDKAYQQVLSAEATEERVVFISEREFWVAALRELHPEAFDAIDERFQQSWQAVEAQWESSVASEAALGHQEYLRQATNLRKEREQALATLALKLTREAIETPV
ncbi:MULTISPECIES: NEL-type E3 ubiquitin ligase domain-containing protein [unclassified Pseudomonas]|uniref:NEL-type E3 ubiquitin ligase domain-containing protein n=1 Tax=unclassified Pseudomonas TaxID=196821 RepID=UPI000A1EE3AB|nr:MULTISPECIES: NEL-type E3 ubiquitin ligase domain-containing protein [unclassified Pseudomonas]